MASSVLKAIILNLGLDFIPDLNLQRILSTAFPERRGFFSGRQRHLRAMQFISDYLLPRP